MNREKMQSRIHVEVVLAMPERQEIVPLDMAAGSTVADAIAKSAILDRFPDFEFNPVNVGIFSSKATMEQVLDDGDRVEIYRPLMADPKEVRRQKALQQADN